MIGWHKLPSLSGNYSKLPLFCFDDYPDMPITPDTDLRIFGEVVDVYEG